LFEDAVQLASTQRLIAPVYFILSGVNPGEGAVVTRNRTVADDVWRLDADAGRWFLVETNDDHWKPPQDARRDTANKAMNAIGQANIDITSIFGVISTQPVFNAETKYTILVSSVSDFYQAFIREDAPPAVPGPQSFRQAVERLGLTF